MKKILFIITLMMVSALPPVCAQTRTEEETYAILEKALGPVASTDNYAIWFEGIALELSDPKAIFSLPEYKIYRGGFLFYEQQKFEMQLGMLKSLCDGKLMVMIDETSKTMYVDSFRTSMPAELGEQPDIAELLKETFGEGEISWEGFETIQGRSCHKIRINTKGEYPTHSLYWVEQNTGKLFFWAEWQDGKYDVYWVNKIGTTPQSHEFNINLPKEEITSFYGYQVTDMRYAFVQARQKTNNN